MCCWKSNACWYCEAHLTQHDPQREPMEYSSRWVPSHWGSRWSYTFHVVCVNFIRVGYQCNFWWNTGLKPESHKSHLHWLPNMNKKDTNMKSTCPTQNCPTQTIFYQVALGLALGPQGFPDTNMFSWYRQRKAVPNANGIAFWWNI